jgi:secreted trypsin-like serine protease
MEGHIINGVQIPIAMYPYFALLLYQGFGFCGGAIISSRIIITAAHCLVDENLNTYPKGIFQVQLGNRKFKIK